MLAPQRMNTPRRMGAAAESTMFPHTVTLYTVRTEEDKTTFKEETKVYITILRGVLCDETKGSNVRASGLEGADAVSLYVPFDVKAIDPADVGKEKPPVKKYIGPVEFNTLEDKSGYWTLETGLSTWFVKGEVLPPDGIKPENVETYINMTHDNVYNVTKVDIKDFGGLPHFEIGGA